MTEKKTVMMIVELAVQDNGGNRELQEKKEINTSLQILFTEKS